MLVGRTDDRKGGKNVINKQVYTSHIKEMVSAAKHTKRISLVGGNCGDEVINESHNGVMQHNNRRGIEGGGYLTVNKLVGGDVGNDHIEEVEKSKNMNGIMQIDSEESSTYGSSEDSEDSEDNDESTRDPDEDLIDNDVNGDGDGEEVEESSSTGESSNENSDDDEKPQEGDEKSEAVRDSDSDSDSEVDMSEGDETNNTNDAQESHVGGYSRYDTFGGDTLPQGAKSPSEASVAGTTTTVDTMDILGADPSYFTLKQFLLLSTEKEKVERQSLNVTDILMKVVEALDRLNTTVGLVVERLPMPLRLSSNAKPITAQAVVSSQKEDTKPREQTNHNPMTPGTQPSLATNAERFTSPNMDVAREQQPPEQTAQQVPAVVNKFSF